MHCPYGTPRSRAQELAADVFREVFNLLHAHGVTGLSNLWLAADIGALREHIAARLEEHGNKIRQDTIQEIRAAWRDR